MFPSPRAGGGYKRSPLKPVDGYYEDKYGKINPDELIGRAELCESEDDSDSDLSQNLSKTPEYKRGLKSFKEQAKKRRESTRRNRDAETSNNKYQSKSPDKKGQQSFGMFGHRSSNTGGRKRNRSDGGSPMKGNTSTFFPDLVNLDAQDSDVESTTPNANPLKQFLKSKPKETETAQSEFESNYTETIGGQDPMSDFFDGAKESVLNAKKSSARARRHALRRPSTRPLVMPQKNHQDEEEDQKPEPDPKKKGVRQSTRNSAVKSQKDQDEDEGQRQDQETKELLQPTRNLAAKSQKTQHAGQDPKRQGVRQSTRNAAAKSQKNQNEVQGPAKKGIRQSTRNASTKQPYYYYYGDKRRNINSVETPSHKASMSTARGAPDNNASEWSPWSKTIDAAKVLLDLGNIDKEEYTRYY